MKRFWMGIVIADVVAIHVAVGYMLSTQWTKSSLSAKPALTEQVTVPVVSPVQSVDSCGAACMAEIQRTIQALTPPSKPAVAQPTSTPSPTSPVTAKTIVATKAPIRSVVYVPIPGSGSVAMTEWMDVSGTDFYFNASDYSGLTEAYLELNGKLFNGNGLAYFRLFDVTHGIGVQGSEVQTSTQASTPLVSGKLSFWAGKNLYRIQAKSLTADTAVYDGGRIRIIVVQ